MVAYNQEIMESLSDYTGNFNERVMAYLEDQGIPRSSYNEMLRNYLLAEGYEGYTLNELIRNVDGGLAQLFAAVKRSILDFNGTQYATLSEPVVLDGDFEIEFVVCPTNIEGADETLIGKSDDNRGFIRISQGYIHVNMTQSSNHTIFGLLPMLENNKIQRIVVRRIGSDVTVAYAEQSETITVADLSNNSFDWIGAKAGFLTFDGIFFSTRIWKNGDRFTGELVTDLRFDEPDTNYQRNYAVEEVVHETLPTPLSNTEENVIIDWFLDTPLPAGQWFSIEYDISGGSRVDLRLNTGGQLIELINEEDEFKSTRWFKTDEVVTRIRFRAYSAGITVNSSVIKSFSGAILENTLPGDWEEISQKSGETDWTNAYWPNLLQYSSDLTASSWYRTRLDVEYLGGETKLTTVTANDSHIRQEVSKVSGASTYTAGCRIKGPAGLPIRIIIFRDGYAEYNTSDGIILTGEYQDISHTYEFTTEPQETVRMRLDFAHLDEGGQLGDEYFVSQAYFVTGDTVNYVDTQERAGRILQYAEGALVEPISQVDLQQQESFESFFTTFVGGTTPDVATADTTTLTMSETTGTLGDPMVNTYATKLSGITEPVYFEIRVDATQGQAAWDDIEPYIGIGCDFEKFIHFAMGDSSAQNYGGFVLSSITKATQLYADGGETFLFSDIRYPEDENLAAAGWIRVGVRYDPSTREIWLHVFYENTVDISFRTATGPFQSGSNSVATVAEPYTTTTVTNAADSADDELCITLSANRYYYGAGDTTLEILTQESDFLLPGGVPSGYTALHNVTGTETSEYDLGDYIMAL